MQSYPSCTLSFFSISTYPSSNNNEQRRHGLVYVPLFYLSQRKIRLRTSNRITSIITAKRINIWSITNTDRFIRFFNILIQTLKYCNHILSALSNRKNFATRKKKITKLFPRPANKYIGIIFVDRKQPNSEWPFLTDLDSWSRKKWSKHFLHPLYAVRSRDGAKGGKKPKAQKQRARIEKSAKWRHVSTVRFSRCQGGRVN